MTKNNLIPVKEVTRRTGISRATIYRRIKEKRFPAPVKVDNASLWVESEIDGWINSRIQERDAA